MKLTIFGATGRTGKHLVEQTLAAGHQVTALVRNPAKVTGQHERLRLIQGDVQDAAQVEAAVAGAEAVISVLGPTSNTPDYQVSKGTENILAAMTRHGVRRLVISAGMGVGDPNDAPKFVNKFFNVLLRLLSRHVYEDMRRVVEIVRASDREWTIVRVPVLTEEPKKGVFRVGYVGKGPERRLSRADMANFMLQQVTDNTYLRQAPAISN